MANLLRFIILNSRDGHTGYIIAAYWLLHHIIFMCSRDKPVRSSFVNYYYVYNNLKYTNH